MSGGDILLLVLMLGVLGVLVCGVVLMMVGGERNRKYGNKLMVLRVSLQAVVVALVGVMLMMSK
jgi:hypothetical protein